MKFVSWLKKIEPDPLVRPVDLAIASGVQNLMAFTEVEREEIMNGIAARAFSEKKHIHKNPQQNGKKIIGRADAFGDVPVTMNTDGEII